MNGYSMGGRSLNKSMAHPLQEMYDTHLRMWHGLCTIGNGVSVKGSSVHPTAGLGLFAH